MSSLPRHNPPLPGRPATQSESGHAEPGAQPPRTNDEATTDMTDLKVGPAEMQLAPQPASAGVARRFVREVLGDSHPQAEVAALLISELATNAILHARTPFAVRVEDSAQRVRCEVGDASAARARRRHHAPEATTGRGLSLISTLADAWGMDSTDTGKVVWFELPA